MTPAPDPASFRSEFPVLERVAYLNAGTEGPVPRRAAEAAHARIDLETVQGRCGRPYFDELMEMASRVRDGYAAVAGLDLRPGDEIVTSDEEHPGLLAPLGRAIRSHGVVVQIVPFAELPAAVSASTRLVACSHVSWASGRIADVEALRAAGAPVLLDAAQALGAIPVDVGSLGCDFYAASGQKWLCGPEGSGCLFVREDRLDELVVPWPGYSSVADPEQALDFAPAEGVKRLDHGFPTGLRSAWVLASLEVLGGAGWDWVHERAASLAARLAERLRERGLEVLDRDRSTLVSWHAEDAAADVARLAEAGIVVRSIPAFGLVRASVGAWSSEEEVERLAELAVAA
jgi:selenocysteine lyase/cysteine desulfurase